MKTHSMEECVTCGKKILVIHDGPSLLIDSVVCGNHIAEHGVNEFFTYQHPSEAMEIEDWAHSSKESANE